MAERSLGQLSLADSLVAGAGRNATLERLDELIDWSAIARLLSPVHGSRYGAPGLPGGGDAQGIVVAAMAWVVGPRPGGVDRGSAEFPPVLRLRTGRRDAGPCDDPSLPRDAAATWPGGSCVRGGQPPDRQLGPDRAAGHADRRQPGRRGGEAAQAAGRTTAGRTVASRTGNAAERGEAG